MDWMRALRFPYVVALIGMVALGTGGLVGAWLYQKSKVPSLRLSAGPESSRRAAVANDLRRQAAEHGLTLSLVSSAGSEESLKWLQEGKLDAAIVSSGVKIPEDDEIAVLGALQLEAVHVLVRPELVSDRPLAQSIRGKRVNFGERGSTDWLLTREFLAFGRLTLPSGQEAGDIIPTEFGHQDIVEQCLAIANASSSHDRQRRIAELPDCLLVLDTLPSSAAQALIQHAGYVLCPLPATRAFLLDQLQDTQSPHTIIEREFLEHTSIQAHSYLAGGVFPETDCETVGSRLLVVARKDLSGQVIQPLMKAMFESEFTHRIQPKSPHNLAGSYAMHPAAASYFDRDKPMMVMKQAIDWFKTALSLFGAFSAGALSLYGLIWRKKTRTASEYLAEIRNVGQTNRNSQDESEGSHPSPHMAKELDHQLLRLRQDMIDDVCSGRMKADQSFFNVLMLLKDTRRDLRMPDPDADELPRSAVRRRYPSQEAA